MLMSYQLSLCCGWQPISPTSFQFLVCLLFFLRNFPQDQNEKNTEVVFEVANIKPLD